MKNKIKILSVLLVLSGCSTQEEPMQHIIRESKYLMNRNDTERELEGGTWQATKNLQYQFSYDAVKGKWKKSIYLHDSGAIRKIVEESYEVKQDFWGQNMHWFGSDDILPVWLAELVRIDKDTYRRYLRIFDINDPNATSDYKKMKRACEVTGKTFSPDFWKREW
ncbi:MAG: hypothetical protein ACRCV0_02780 [Brevinema sp.]